MLRVGVIGLGMMGNTHLDVYAKRTDVQVVAISDANPRRLSGEERAAGNIEGQAKASFDINAVKKYEEGKKLIRDKSIDIVDICLPTPLHARYLKYALKAGKHVMLEKPVARTAKEALRLVKLTQKTDRMVMVGMCMRFWPGWTWLKDAVQNQTYGKVYAAHFRRVANHPGGAFYSDGEQCGGAILDLHIHDTDFIQYLFGMPRAVQSVGYTKLTGHTDHVMTRYIYEGPNAPPMVVAEGGWVMSPGFGFSMRYTVNFEKATAIFDLDSKDVLTLVENGQRRGIPLEQAMGYEKEIDYFINCVKTGQKPSIVTVESAANSVKIVEAEIKSVRKNKTVKIK